MEITLNHDNEAVFMHSVKKNNLGKVKYIQEGVVNDLSSQLVTLLCFSHCLKSQANHSGR